MIRISSAFDFNAVACNHGPHTEMFDRGGAGGEAAAVNRLFTMPRDWAGDAQAQEHKSCPVPGPGCRFSVRLSGL
jgi:hypothetical protein